ncbi:hypothetical protein PENSPDRAFT_233192 [Peniophora sp. CONT]|nr:hypothetical protein PENSPDRAFT_233192 [Peniophora sp. CONT]
MYNCLRIHQEAFSADTANSLLAQASRIPAVGAYIQQIDDSIATGHASIQLEESIELDISALEAAAHRLRASRNSCRPLLRLPLETLGEIIQILVSIWPAKTGYDVVRPFYRRTKRDGLELGWVLLGHVCHKLRTALLARSDIWARNISSITRSPTGMDFYYKDSPLHLETSIHHWGHRRPALPSAYIDFIVQHIGVSRVVHLDECSPWTDVALFANLDPGLFSKSAFPHLQELVLSSTTDPYQTNPALTAEILELPEMVAPNLRSLRLQDYLISFDPSALTSLELIFSWQFSIEPTSTSLYSKRDFLKMLPRFHNLRSLKLERCIPLLSFGVDEEEKTVFLGSLEDVHLNDNIRRCLSLLSRLSAPASTRYHVALGDTTTEFPGPSAHLQAALPHFEQMDTSCVSGLTIDEDRSTELTLYEPTPDGTFSGGYLGPFYRDFREHLLVRFYAVRCDEPRMEIMLSCLQKFVEFSNITTLQIGSSIAYNCSAWAAFLTRFPHLATLHLLDRCPTSALLVLTAPDPDDLTQSESNCIVAPKLHSLWIHFVDLRGPRNEADVQRQGPTRLQFLRMLSSRRKAGVPLADLQIETLIALDPKEGMKSLKPRLETLVARVEVKRILARDPETGAVHYPFDYTIRSSCMRVDDEDEDDEDEDIE